MPQYLGAALCRFTHEIPHLRMRRLDVSVEAVLLKPLGSDRADRCNQHFRKTPAHRVFLVHLSGDLEQMVYLYARGEQDDVKLVLGNGRDGGTQWLNIVRQPPFINGDTRYVRAAMSKT